MPQTPVAGGHQKEPLATLRARTQDDCQWWGRAEGAAGGTALLGDAAAGSTENIVRANGGVARCPRPLSR